MDEGIKIPIELDPNGTALSYLKNFDNTGKTTFTNFSNNAATAPVALGKIKASTNDLVISLKNNLDPEVYKAFVGGSLNINTMTDAVQTLKENMRFALNPAEVAQYSSGIRDLENNIKRLEESGSQNIFQKLGLKGGDGFGSIINQLRQIAYILPGIGVAGIFSAIFSGITSLIDGLGKTEEAFDRTAAAMDNFKTQMSNVTKSVEDAKKELDFSIQLNKIQSQITHGTGNAADIFSLKDENKLLDNFVLNTQNKIDKLKSDLKRGEQIINILGGKVIGGKDFETTINELPDAVIKAQSKSLQDQIELYKTNSETIKKIQAEQDNAINISVTNEYNLQLKRNEQSRKILEDRFNLYKNAQQRFIDLNNTLFSQTGFVKARDDSYDAQVELIKKTAEFEISQSDHTKDAINLIEQKKTFALEDALNKRDKDIRDFNEKVTAETSKNLNTKSFQLPIINISASDIENVDSEIAKINEQVSVLTKVNGRILGIDLSGEIDSLKQRLQLLEKIKEITDLIKAPAATKNETNLFENNELLKNAQRQFQQFGTTGENALLKVFSNTKPVEDNIKALGKLMDQMKLVKQLGDNIGHGLSSAFNSTFEAILSGKNAFQALGEAVKQLVVQTIEAIAEMLILSFVKNLIFPGASSIGSFQGIPHAGGIPHFAEGGLISGSTLALVGEGHGTSSLNPEVIAPLDQLKNFFSDVVNPGSRGNGLRNNVSTNQTVISMPREVVLRGEGRDLVGVIALETASQRRAG